MEDVVLLGVYLTGELRVFFIVFCIASALLQLDTFDAPENHLILKGFWYVMASSFGFGIMREERALKA